MKPIIKAALGFFTLCMITTGTAQTVVFNSLGPNDTYAPLSLYFVNNLGGPPLEQAAQFTAQTSGFLSTIELGITHPNLAPPAAVNVFLYSDTNGLPNSANQTLLGSAEPSPDAVSSLSNNNLIATIEVSQQVLVTSGTIYWLVLKPTTDYLTYWNFSSNTFGQMSYSLDGSTWNHEPNPIQSAGAPPNLAAFRISAVPEPVAALFVILTLPFLLLIQGRRHDAPDR